MEKDEESGMYYYRARYYSPWLCRFISVDPLACKYVFQSPYAYADNNPINKMDYNGEGTEEGGTPSDNKSQNTQNLNTKPDVIQVDPSLYAKAERIKPNQTKEEVQAEYDSSKKPEADKKTYDTKINQINEYNKLKDSIKRLETLKSDLMKAESGPLAVIRDEVIKNGATVF